MKVVEKAIMLNGIEIQLEEWDDGLMIGAYPIAKNTGKYGWVKNNECFRISIHSNEYRNYTDDDVRADFEALKNGEKIIEDLSDYFWDGEKDMWYLGMDVEYKGW